MTSPKLRFKEFGGCWENTSFQSLFTFKNGINASKEQYGSGTKFINVLDIINNPNGITYDSIIGSVQVFQKDIDKNLVNYGDVVFQRSSETREEVGQSNVYLSKEPVVFGGFVIRGSARVPYDPLFMNGLLKTDKVRDQITQLSGGSTRFNIGQDSLNKVSVFLPSKEEQTKIASFLSAVDEKISQLSQKHQLLSQYKQGMMQKLFSQQIRFKADDGGKFGEWEEKTLIDSVDTNIKWSFTGGPFGSNLKSEDYTELGIRIIQLQNIGDGAFLNDYKIYTSPEKANELLSCNIYPDEILISKMGDPVARCCIVPKHHDRYVMCSDGIRLVVDKQNYSSIFMFYQINYQDFRQSASDVSTGSTRKRIGLSDLKQLPIKVPCLEEQTKIANFFSSIDQKIEVVAQQIEQAKTWKKGLLQQMFV